MSAQMEDRSRQGLQVVLGIQRTPLPDGDSSHDLAYSYDNLALGDIRPLLESHGVRITPVGDAMIPIVSGLIGAGNISIKAIHSMEGSYDDTMKTEGILILEISERADKPNQTLVFFNAAKRLETMGLVLPKKEETILTSTLEKTAAFYAIQSTLMRDSLQEAQGVLKERYISELDALRSALPRLVQELKNEVTVTPTAWIQMGIIPNIPDDELLPLITPDDTNTLDHFTREYYGMAQFFYNKHKKALAENH